MTGQAPVTTLDTERGGGEDRGDQATTGHMDGAQITGAVLQRELRERL